MQALLGAADSGFWTVVAAHWTVWLVSVVLVVAAVIDGIKLKVPNWLTFPFFFAGLCYTTATYGGLGCLWSLGGATAGLLLLLPLYAIGGMGAGDVKLLAGVGAWMYAMQQAAGSVVSTQAAMFYAFALSVIVGAVLAVAMVLVKRDWVKHQTQFFGILREIFTVRDAEKLSEIAAERKPRMLLLPYGIPIAIGTIAYFAWTGMLV